MSGGAPRRYYANQDGGRNRRPRRGDKRRLTREDIHSEIRKREDELAKMLERRNAMKNEQRNLRTNAVELYKQKDNVHAQLAKLQKDISVKTDELNKNKATVQYKSVERHDEAIRRIEQQLQHTNFKLSEEKRLVLEIDSLKKSKRDLAKYKQVLGVLDDLKSRQRAFRGERNGIFAAIGDSKKKEEHVKAELKHLQADIDQIKNVIEELQNRQQNVPTHSSSGDECQSVEIDTDGRVASSEGSVEGATAFDGPSGATGRKKDCQINPEDFEDINETDMSDVTRDIENRKTLCRNLIGYLRNLLPDWAAVTNSFERSEYNRPQPPSRLSLEAAHSSSPATTPVDASAAGASSGVANPKVASCVNDSSTLMSPSASSAAVSALMAQHNPLPNEQIMRRRPAGVKLQRSARILHHKPDVFNQFDMLNMQPPSGVAELPDCIQRLTNLLEELIAAPSVCLSPVAAQEVNDDAATPASSADRSVGFERSLSNPSNDESGFSELSTTPLRPISPDLLRCGQKVPDSPSMTSITHDDLLSTSSTICSEDNGPSSSTDTPPLAASASSA